MSKCDPTTVKNGFKKYISILIVLLLISCGKNQKTPIITNNQNLGTMSGKVLDRIAKQGIPDVVVVSQGKQTISLSDGSFSLQDLPPGEVTISTYKEGYIGFSITCNTNRIDLELEPKSENIIFGKVTVKGVFETPCRCYESGMGVYRGISFFHPYCGKCPICAPDPCEEYDSFEKSFSLIPGIYTVWVNHREKLTTYRTNIQVKPNETTTVELIIPNVSNTNSGSIKLNSPTNGNIYTSYYGVGNKSVYNFIIYNGIFGSCDEIISNVSPGVYWVGATAIHSTDSNKVIYVWGDNITVNVGKAAEVNLNWPNFLETPKLVSPENNATGVGITPTFSWEPVSGANAYLVELEDIWQGITTKNYITYSGFPALKVGETYDWRVTAVNISDFDVNKFNWVDAESKVNSGTLSGNYYFIR